jgi:uncharacterized NAD(P)/FAD-binding protein YdhS
MRQCAGDPLLEWPVPVDAGGEAAFDVVVVGGGASGTLVLIQLLRSAGPPLRIAVVEPRPRLGEGIAYSTPCPEHVLNVIASRMTAIDGEPDHFVDFLARDAANAGIDRVTLGERFARRMDYARYLRSTLEQAPGYGGVRWLADEAMDIERGHDSWRVGLASGRRVDAAAVVLAIGNEPRALPVPPDAMQAAGRVLDAWDYAPVRAIARDDAVCIVGSGLSMVDAMASLAATEHAGPVTVVSRHGLVPLPHDRPGSQHGVAADLVELGMRQRLRVLRARAREAMAEGHPWQWTMDALRHHSETLWRHASTTERARFLRHLARYWDIHRHRIAPESAVMLASAAASDRLHVRAGRVLAIDDAGAAARVRFLPRGGGAEAVLEVAHVINATGIETAFRRSRRPLLPAMQARGLVVPGPMGLGIATGADGAVLDASGAPLPGVMTMGASRIGDLWESIAIPELRVQARRIAERLRQPAPASASV